MSQTVGIDPVEAPESGEVAVEGAGAGSVLASVLHMTEQVGWTMDVEAGEPVVAEWRVVDMAELWAGLSVRRPLIIAVDGRSAAGKSTLARALAAMAPGVGVVHTDDLAWYEPLFGWAHLLRDGVLAPTRRGERVSFAPPAWRERGRPGAVEVDAELDCLIVEGVGSAHSSGADLLDAVVWMQCDRHAAERRGIEGSRVGGEW